MNTRALPLFALACLAPSAFAQQRADALLRPITAPVKYAGVYHLGTGTWTNARTGGSPAASTSPGILYDNTCTTYGGGAGYFGAMTLGSTFVDEGRLPSTSSRVRPNLWGYGNDSEIGTQDSYTIDGFQIAYCSGETTSRTVGINFYEAYDACTVRPATATAAFVITGLPASAAAGVLTCWTIDVDLCASSLSFDMQADADQTYDGLPTGVGDTFGWSIQWLSSTPHFQDGPMMAGGLLAAGSPMFCSGSDGTLFDTGSTSPIYPANSDAISLACGTLPAGSAPERGSGMGSQDRWRIEGYTGINYGCYWFDSPPGNFYLQLYSADVRQPSSGSSFCDPGSSGVLACPCANPPSGTQRGCDNSAGSGGASLNSSGAASLSADTIAFATAGELPSANTILVQGTNDNNSGVYFGQGVRCVTGTLKRLYVHTASGGSISVPGPGDPSVSARSAALGNPIASGSPRYYFAMYRDPVVLGGCPPTKTFNCTNASAVLWH